MGRLVDTLRAVGALDNTLVSRFSFAHRFAIFLCSWDGMLKYSIGQILCGHISIHCFDNYHEYSLLAFMFSQPFIDCIDFQPVITNH